jgi:hypothetical protein
MAYGTLFISYSSRDRAFARRIRVDAEANGCITWIDEKDIEAGDSIPTRIEHGLQTCDVFLLLVSAVSLSSPWVQREYETALALQLNLGERRPRIVPALLDHSAPPPLLRPVKWLSFSDSYTRAIVDLLKTLGVQQPEVRTDRLLWEFDEIRHTVEHLAGTVKPDA